MSFKSNQTAAAKRRLAVEYIAAQDVQSRCAAAARMVARGKDWDPEDRADIAAEVFLKVWAKATATPATEAPGIGTVQVLARPSSVAHGPAVRYSKYSAQKSLDTVKPHAGTAGAIRADLCAWEYLLGLASTERRSIERTRERDFQETLKAAETAPTFEPWIELPADETGGTPWGARRSALEMLRALGMVGDRVAWGPLWTLAYAAARAVESKNDDGSRGGLDRETVAAELELDPATVRQHIARAAARIPASRDGYGSRADWAEALHMPDGGVALKPSRSRTSTADIGTRHTGPRDYVRPVDAAPVTVRRSAALKRAPLAWKIGPSYRPHWTHGLPTRTASRLAAAATYRQTAVRD